MSIIINKSVNCVKLYYFILLGTQTKLKNKRSEQQTNIYDTKLRVNRGR